MIRHSLALLNTVARSGRRLLEVNTPILYSPLSRASQKYVFSAGHRIRSKIGRYLATSASLKRDEMRMLPDAPRMTTMRMF